MATQELVQVKQQETETRAAFLTADETVKEEYERYCFDRLQDFQDDLDLFVEKQVEFNTQLLQIFSLLQSDLELL